MWLPDNLDLVVAYAVIARHQGEALDFGLAVRPAFPAFA
jgi:hypothetical protein